MNQLDYLEAIKAAEKKDIYPVYILLGESFYLKEQLLQTLVKNFLPSGEQIEKIDASERSLTELLDFKNYGGLFASKRLLLFKNLQELKAQQRKDFFSQLKPQIDSVLLLEWEDDLPPDLQLGDEASYVLVKEPILSEKQLSSFIIRAFRARGKKINEEAIDYLISHVGNKLEDLMGEIEKVSLFKGDEDEVSLDDVRQVVFFLEEGEVFDLVDAILSGKRGKALQLLQQFLQGKESPGRLLFLLFRQFRLLWQLLELGEIKRPDYYILAKKLYDHPLAVKKAMEYLPRFSSRQVQRALEELTAIDQAIKIKGEDVNLLLEKFVVEFASN